MMLCKDVAEDIQSCKEHIHYASLSLKEKLSALKNIMPLVLVTAVLRIGFLSVAIFNITSTTKSNYLQRSSLETGICSSNNSMIMFHDLSNEEKSKLQLILISLEAWMSGDSVPGVNNIVDDENEMFSAGSSTDTNAMTNSEIVSLLGLVVVFFGPVIPIYFLIQKYKTTNKIVSFNDCAVGMMSEVSFIYNWSLLSPEIGRKIQLFLNLYISGLGVGYCVWFLVNNLQLDRDNNLLFVLIILTAGIMQVPLYLLEYSYGFLEKLDVQSVEVNRKPSEVKIRVFHV